MMVPLEKEAGARNCEPLRRIPNGRRNCGQLMHSTRACRRLADQQKLSVLRQRMSVAGLAVSESPPGERQRRADRLSKPIIPLSAAQDGMGGVARPTHGVRHWMGADSEFWDGM